MASSSFFNATHSQPSISSPSINDNDKIENLSQFETCYRACLERNDPTPNDLVVRSRSWLSSISEKELKSFIKTILKPEFKDDSNQVRLRHVQLQALIRLQLLLVQEQVFLQRYIKICKPRNNKKSRTTPTKTPQDVLLDDIICTLSTAAFLLDQNQPFAQFLYTILTKQLYTCLPYVVSALSDAFEIPNPYLPIFKDDMELEPVMPVKRKKRKLPAPSQQPHAPPKRMPLSSKKNRFQGSHFHASHKLDAISKLLDATPRPAMTMNRLKLTKITPQSMPSSKHSTLGCPNRLLTSKSKSALLPPKRPKSSLLKEPSSRRTVVQETPAAKSRHRQVQATPIFHSPVPQQRYPPPGTVQETPTTMMFHSPVPQSQCPFTMPFNNRPSVQETLAFLPSLNDNTHRSVQETPGLHDRGRLAPETPERPMDLETSASTTNLPRVAPESPAMDNGKPFLSPRPVRPMNLFG